MVTRGLSAPGDRHLCKLRCAQEPSHFLSRLTGVTKWGRLVRRREDTQPWAVPAFLRMWRVDVVSLTCSQGRPPAALSVAEMS